MMVLVYSKIITPRIKYVFNHILKTRLGLEIDFTSDIDLFKKYNSFKISYNDIKLVNEFNIVPAQILFSSKI